MSGRQSLQKVLFLALALMGLVSKVNAQIVGYIDFHPRYKLIANIGNLLDYNSEAVLYSGPDRGLSTFTISSGATTLVSTNATGPAFFTPGGFLFLTSTPEQFVQVEGDQQFNLGAPSYFPPDFNDRFVEGRFAVLHMPDGLVLRDLVARTNCLLSTNFGFADVAANGSVVFTTTVDETNIAVRFFQNGEIKTLALLPTYPIPYVATDGTNVLWGEPLSPPFGSLYLQTPTEKITLATNVFVASSPPVATTIPRMINVALKNGWLVFPRFGEGNLAGLNNLWRRAPDGTITQLTTSPGFVLAMRKDGGLLMAGGDNQIQSSVYYISPTGTRKAISPDYPLARYFAIGDKFYAWSLMPGYIGGTGLYEVETEQDPFGILYPAYDSSTGQFSCYLETGIAGDYQLQRTTDFKEWTPVATTTASNTIPVQIQVSTAPGYFRVIKL